MSQAAREQEAPARGQPRHELIGRAGAVVRRFETLRAEIAAVGGQLDAQRRATVRALAAEALTRAELTEALLAAMAGRAALGRELRSLARRLYFPGGPARPPPFGRTDWRLRGLLARLGAPGQALLIAGSGF